MSNINNNQESITGHKVQLVGHIFAEDGKCWVGSQEEGFFIETGLGYVYASVYMESFYPADILGPVVKKITIEFPVPYGAREVHNEALDRSLK